MMDFMVQIVLSLLIWWAQLFDDRELGAVVHRERSGYCKRISNPEGFFVATADHGLAERRGYGYGFLHLILKTVQVNLRHYVRAKQHHAAKVKKLFHGRQYLLVFSHSS